MCQVGSLFGIGPDFIYVGYDLRSSCTSVVNTHNPPFMFGNFFTPPPQSTLLTTLALRMIEKAVAPGNVATAVRSWLFARTYLPCCAVAVENGNMALQAVRALCDQQISSFIVGASFTGHFSSSGCAWVLWQPRCRFVTILITNLASPTDLNRTSWSLEFTQFPWANEPR